MKKARKLAILLQARRIIGKHLTERLVNEGNKVTVYDNLISGKLEHITPNLGKPNLLLSKPTCLISRHYRKP